LQDSALGATISFVNPLRLHYKQRLYASGEHEFVCTFVVLALTIISLKCLLCGLRAVFTAIRTLILDGALASGMLAFGSFAIVLSLL